MKIQWLDRGLIYGPHLCLCLNKKQFKKALKHLGIPKADRPPFVLEGANATLHTLEKGGKLTCVVCIDAEGRKLTQVHGLLVHEAVHVWQKFKDNIGEQSPSSEFEAYSIQMISQTLFEEYERQTGDTALV